MDKAEKSGLPEWGSREENGSERSKGLRVAEPLYFCSFEAKQGRNFSFREL
jgi:hypothetical protein